MELNKLFFFKGRDFFYGVDSPFIKCLLYTGAVLHL